MLVLRENEPCPYSTKCPYNQFNTCNGAQSNRLNTFECELVDNGIFTENGMQRSGFDITGKMKVILE